MVMIVSISARLRNRQSPVMAIKGMVETYFMVDLSYQEIGVFKPVDEEPLAENNPHNSNRLLEGEGLKVWTKVGEGAVRKMIAYVLDDMGFAGVPPTTMINCIHHRFNHP